MGFRVENKPVSRREFYATVVGIMTFIAMVVMTSESSPTYLLGFIVLVDFVALVELLRTRRTS